MHVKTSTAQTSVFVACGSAGGQLILPLLVGALFDTRLGSISLMWVVLTDTLLSLALLFGLYHITTSLMRAASSRGAQQNNTHIDPVLVRSANDDA